MKKVLFATTAAVAFTVAGAAQAQVELGLGGYWQEWFGFANQDANLVNWDQQSDKEIHVKGSTTLDNGITVGVRFEIEANDVDKGNKHDESVLTVSGGFGTLILGNEDNGANLLHVSAPDVGVGLQSGDIVGGDWVFAGNTNNAPTATAISDADDVNKVTYVLPTFAGFTAGASFIPDAAAAGGQGAMGGPMPADNATVPAYGVAAQYANNFGEAAVKASIGYAWANDDIAAGDVEVKLFSLGLQVGFADFSFGGSYFKGNTELAGVDQARVSGTGYYTGKAWEVGASYSQDPWAVSIGYFTSENDVDQSERRVFQGSFSYNLGPGIDWKNTIASARFTDNGGTKNDGWAAVTGFALTF